MPDSVNSQDDPLGSIAGNAVGDHPTKIDTLGFRPYVDAIASFLLSEETNPPFTISIEGEWGSGKSSFLLQLQDAISGPSKKDALLDKLPIWLGGQSKAGSISAALAAYIRRRQPITVTFNAWRHDKQDALWASFALAFIESLRREIGSTSAWKGDIKLLWHRLRRTRGWLELCLLIASLSLLVLASLTLVAYIHSHPSTDFFKSLIARLLDTKNGLGEGIASTAQRLFSHGAWGVVTALALSGLYKFHSYIKMPLSLNLKKYISKPDYEGHVSFIESFHKDLSILIKAYAGSRRVFIFIDDLDRCDVPRAAELMQAINLMIGEAENLVFILGMDREKVAAGVALKYKDLLPFLRESATWKPGVDATDFTPLYFGYSYLEKFIQLSFSIPTARDYQSLDQFLSLKQDNLPTYNWQAAVWRYWRLRLRVRQEIGSTDRPKDSAEGDALNPQPTLGEPWPSNLGSSASPLREIVFRRITIKDDGDRIRNIVRMSSKLFDNNPRRIKQFTNTFRLALFVASEQGLFDFPSLSVNDRPTPEQVGKFVALMLRFPDLRIALSEAPGLLGELEVKAVAMLAKPADSSLPRPRWLEKNGAVALLTYGVVSGQGLYGPPLYSLEKFDATPFFSVLPRAVRPPEPASLGAITPTHSEAPASDEALPTIPITPEMRQALEGIYEANEKAMLTTNDFELLKALNASQLTIGNVMMADDQYRLHADARQFEVVVKQVNEATMSLRNLQDRLAAKEPASAELKAALEAIDFTRGIIPDTKSNVSADSKPPVEPPDATSRLFDEFAARYEKTRSSQRPSSKRTEEMSKIFDDAFFAASKLGTKTIRQQIERLRSRGNQGSRLMLLALASAKIDASNTSWLLQMLDNYRTPFEHYRCIRTLLRYVASCSDEVKYDIILIIDKRWADIKKDEGRVADAVELKRLASVGLALSEKRVEKTEHSPDANDSSGLPTP